MKKIVMFLLAGMLAAQSMCMAAGAANDLKRYEKVAEKFSNIFSQTTPTAFPEYKKCLVGFEQVSENDFNKMVQDITREYGHTTDILFDNLHRDLGSEVDVLSYLLPCTKKDIYLKLEMVFTRDGKVAAYSVVPLQVTKNQENNTK